MDDRREVGVVVLQGSGGHSVGEGRPGCRSAPDVAQHRRGARPALGDGEAAGSHRCIEIESRQGNADRVEEAKPRRVGDVRIENHATPRGEIANQGSERRLRLNAQAESAFTVSTGHGASMMMR